MSLKHV